MKEGTIIFVNTVTQLIRVFSEDNGEDPNAVFKAISSNFTDPDDDSKNDILRSFS